MEIDTTWNRLNHEQWVLLSIMHSYQSPHFYGLNNLLIWWKFRGCFIWFFNNDIVQNELQFFRWNWGIFLGCVLDQENPKYCNRQCQTSIYVKVPFPSKVGVDNTSKYWANYESNIITWNKPPVSCLYERLFIYSNTVTILTI